MKRLSKENFIVYGVSVIRITFLYTWFSAVHRHGYKYDAVRQVWAAKSGNETLLCF